MVEVERKFLVKSAAFKALATQVKHIQQGFLSTDPERTIRIRLVDGIGVLTIKGGSSADGTSRFEWEREFPEEEAKSLLNLCLPGSIRKSRYCVAVEAFIFEVDVFYGANKGLILAEVELDHPDQIFPKPDWLGAEVTGDPKYYNSQLSINPYSTWR